MKLKNQDFARSPNAMHLVIYVVQIALLMNNVQIINSTMIKKSIKSSKIHFNKKNSILIRKESNYLTCSKQKSKISIARFLNQLTISKKQ